MSVCLVGGAQRMSQCVAFPMGSLLVEVAQTLLLLAGGLLQGWIKPCGGLNEVPGQYFGDDWVKERK